MTEPKCIIIAGIHRSGTSYLSRCLVDAGIPMWQHDGGDHAECQRLLAINERELARQGLTFRDVSADPIPNQDFIQELIDYKEQREESGAPVYGFKDPRIASLIDGYLHVWPNALYILSVRNLMSAGDSWHKRGNCESMLNGARFLARQFSYASEALGRSAERNATGFNYDNPSWDRLTRCVEFCSGVKVDFETSWKGRR